MLLYSTVMRRPSHAFRLYQSVQLTVLWIHLFLVLRAASWSGCGNMRIWMTPQAKQVKGFCFFLFFSDRKSWSCYPPEGFCGGMWQSWNFEKRWSASDIPEQRMCSLLVFLLASLSCVLLLNVVSCFILGGQKKKKNREKLLSSAVARLCNDQVLWSFNITVIWRFDFPVNHLIHCFNSRKKTTGRLLLSKVWAFTCALLNIFDLHVGLQGNFQMIIYYFE